MDLVLLKLIIILMPVLAQVESNNDCQAVSTDGYHSIGHLQITPICFRDVNTRVEPNFVLEDRADRWKAEVMCKLYLLKWGKDIPLDDPSIAFESLSRIWNGGPQGYHKNATLKYWKKVKKLLKEQNII